MKIELNELRQIVRQTLKEEDDQDKRDMAIKVMKLIASPNEESRNIGLEFLNQDWIAPHIHRLAHQIFGDLERITETSWDKLIELKKLDLSNLNLDKVPNGVDILYNLEELNLSYNNIKELPKNIGNLKSLSILRIDHNPITKLPNSFWDLILVKELNIASTKISEISEDIGKMTNLTSLYANYLTELKTIPQNLTNLNNLEFMELERVPLNSPESKAILTQLRKNGVHIYYTN